VVTLELVVLLAVAREALQGGQGVVLEVALAQAQVMALELAQALVAALEVDLVPAQEMARGRAMVTIKTRRKLLQVASVTRNLPAPAMLSSAK
jgi:hypothetical protein